MAAGCAEGPGRVISVGHRPLQRYEEDTEGVRDVMGTRRDCLKGEESFRGSTRVTGMEQRERMRARAS